MYVSQHFSGKKVKNKEPWNIKQQKQQQNNRISYSKKKLEIIDMEKPPEHAVPWGSFPCISSICNLNYPHHFLVLAAIA